LENTETATVNVNALLKKINTLTALQAHTSNIRVSYEYGDVPEVNASFFHLEQAVLNVINNSIEAMHKGGTLAVKTFLERDGGNDYIVIRVSDTGGGMPVNQKSSTEAGKPGRGFGLFIAREMLQYYGGHLEIQSEKDKGTTVRLCLPVEADRKK
jgi:two-component system nitrogen regulation sensor histidine kinase GlnL